MAELGVPVEPPAIDTRPLFRPLHAELIALLRSLRGDDWRQPATPRWNVREVAAHILDGDLRRLSFQRDGLELAGPGTAPAAGFQDLVAMLDELNAAWQQAARRLSPRVVVDLLRVTGAQVADLMESLALDAPAFFEVAWAGEHQAQAWLDIGREFTEKWHHQQQIRLATGAPVLAEPRYLRPVLGLSMLALPRVYQAAAPPDGTAVAVEVAGESGGSWHLWREEGRWRLLPGPAPGQPAATVRLDQDTAWRLFFKMIGEQEAHRRVRIDGDAALGTPFLAARAVMA